MEEIVALTNPLRTASVRPICPLRDPSDQKQRQKPRKTLRRPTAKASVGQRRLAAKTSLSGGKRHEMRAGNSGAEAAKAGNLSGSVGFLFFCGGEQDLGEFGEKVGEVFREGRKGSEEEIYDGNREELLEGWSRGGREVGAEFWSGGRGEGTWFREFWAVGAVREFGRLVVDLGILRGCCVGLDFRDEERGGGGRRGCGRRRVLRKVVEIVEDTGSRNMSERYGAVEVRSCTRRSGPAMRDYEISTTKKSRETHTVRQMSRARTNSECLVQHSSEEKK